VKTIVLDNISNDSALDVVRQAMPQGVSLLATTREQFPADMGLTPRDVSTLALDDARQILSHYAQRDLTTDELATTLCLALGNLPFLLQLAGRMLRKRDTPKTLLNRYGKQLPRVDIALTGQDPPSVSVMIDQSLNEIDKDTKGTQARAVFMAFGA